jgi:hypothetical protein
MALDELFMGRFEWGLDPIRWAPASGQAGDTPQFSMVDSYSSRGRPTTPEGSLPSVKEYHESDVHQDSNMGQNALSAHALGYWPLVCLFVAIPDSKCPGMAVEPTMGQPSNP